MIKFPGKYSHRDKVQLAHAMFLIDNQDMTRPFVVWLQHELRRLEHDNTWEPDTDVFRQRQGALQAIEGVLDENKNADTRYRELKDNENILEV